MKQLIFILLLVSACGGGEVSETTISIAASQDTTTTTVADTTTTTVAVEYPLLTIRSKKFTARTVQAIKDKLSKIVKNNLIISKQ